MTETHTHPDAVVELSVFIRRLEQERQGERDPVRRRSLGIQLFHLRAEQLRQWRLRERA
jgi:hypothetical protein